MKKSISKVFFLAIFVFSFLAVQGQTTDFPTTDAVWSVYVTESFFKTEDTTVHYLVEGDTLILDITFHKIYAISDSLSFEDTRKEYVGAFRENDKRFVFLAKDSVKYDTLYDFNIEVGTIIDRFENCDPNNPECFYMQLNDIDTIVTSDGIERRKFNFYNYIRFDENTVEGNYSFSWIEGIGSTIGLLPDYYHIYYQYLPVSPLFTYDLLCYKQAESLIYNDPVIYRGSCNVQTLVSTNDLSIEDVFIYPNPTHSNIHISIPNYINNTYTVQLFDISGRNILEQPATSSEINIYIDNLSKGIYFLRIIHNDYSVNPFVQQIIKL